QLANARYVFVMVTPGKGVTLQYRDTTGGSAASAGAAIAGAAPGWLRLTKSGATFTGAWSKDGVTWTTVGTAAVAFGNARLATGLALTSHSTAPATASFDDFRIREK